MEIKPLFARVLLKRARAEKIGSIILPNDVRKRHASLKCRVVAKGPGADDSIRVGSDILIGQYAGAWLSADGSPVPDEKSDEAEFYIVNDEDIIAEVAP